MRLFAAVSLPDDLRSELRKAASPLRAAGADVKWVKAEQLHFTLAFLGETPEQSAPGAVAALQAAAAACAPFEAALGGYGAFPDLDQPKVVWQGLSRGEEGLERLAAALRAELAARGLAFDEKPFVAHLTLGRIQRPGGLKTLKAALESKPAPLPGFRVAAVELLESRLSSAGAEHRLVCSAPLAGA